MTGALKFNKKINKKKEVAFATPLKPGCYEASNKTSNGKIMIIPGSAIKNPYDTAAIMIAIFIRTLIPARITNRMVTADHVKKNHIECTHTFLPLI